MRRHGLPRRRRIARIRRGVHLLPSLFTTANLFCGFISIVMTFEEEYEKAALFIIVAGILDGLDGRIARLIRATTEFGGEYDSLADIVSFGLAPAFLSHWWGMVPLTRYGLLISFLYLVCGAVRLARFNIQHGASDRRWFIGLPIPMAAAVVAACVLEFGGKIENPVLSVAFAAVVLASSFLMVSRVRYRSFKEFGVRRRHPVRVIVSIGVLIAAVLLHPPLLLLVAVFAYMLSGVGTALIPKRLTAKGRAVESGPEPLDAAEKGIASSAP